MDTYDDACLETFLKKQRQLFREDVATNLDEAEAFLEDCMAVVCKNLDEVRDYLEWTYLAWAIRNLRRQARSLRLATADT